MKKNLILPLAGIILLSLATLQSCKKDDTTAPTITLSGDNPYTMEMRTSYAEPGFTANDDEDGNISSSVTSTNNINANLPGEYSVHYAVSDAAGNAASEDRTVNVVATPAALAASYTVVDTCGTSQIFNYTQSITAVNSTTIKFSLFADYSGNINITATVASDGTITIPIQTALNIGTLGDDHTFSGTGKVTVNGIFLDYIDQNLTNSSNAACKAHYTRQ